MIKNIQYTLMILIVIVWTTIIFNIIHAGLFSIGFPMIIWTILFNPLVLPLGNLVLISMINNRFDKDYWFIYYPLLVLFTYLSITNLEFLNWTDYFRKELYNLNLRGKELGIIWTQIYIAIFVIGGASFIKAISLVLSSKNTQANK